MTASGNKAGMLREGITRLLVHIEHPEDADLYKLGVETYYFQPIDDVAQNLRAVALAGLAPIDLSLACIYATRYLGEPFTSVFNCEPAMTAIDVLVQVPISVCRFTSSCFIAAKVWRRQAAAS